MPGTRIFREIDDCGAADSLLNLLSKFYRHFGFMAICYVLPVLGKTDNYRLFERGMPQEWMRTYIEKNLAMVDPIPAAVMKSGKMATLKQILHDSHLSSSQQGFVDEYFRIGGTDGLAMPTFGYNNSRGFFCITQVSDETLSSTDTSLMYAVAQHAHLRFDQFGEKAGRPIANLSPREAEILRWIAAGKSNPDIAAILGISGPTVATHMKRLFSKLDVNDRVSAALRGKDYGLV